MTNLIEGKDLLFQMEVDGEFFDLMCAKNGSFRFEQDEIESTSVASTKQREFVPGMSSCLMSVSGISEIDNSDDRISIMYLLQEAIRGEIHSLRVFMTAQNGDTKQIAFNGFIRSMGMDAPATGYSNCDAEFRITGDVDLDPVAPPDPPACEVEEPIYLEVGNGLTEGEYTAHSDLLEQEGVVILSVARTGAAMHYTTGTPSSLQFTTDLENGDVIFMSSAPFNTGEWVRIIYKVVT
jgi:hypothetical protein